MTSPTPAGKVTEETAANKRMEVAPLQMFDQSAEPEEATKAKSNLKAQRQCSRCT